MSAHSIPDAPYQLDLEIAGISLSIQSFLSWKEDPAFTPFQKKTETPDFRVVFHQVNELPALPETVFHEDHCYRVHPDGKGGYLRSFFDAPRDLSPYAAAEYDYADGNIQIKCLPKGNACVAEIHNSFFHIGFEAMLVHRQRLCFHAACVDTHLGGVLFSGPSGAGKSTQARLWCDHFGAGLINGDRPILSKTETGWLAWGSPYAGSSRCYLNENCPVKAIVLPLKAKECSLQRLQLPEAFRAVWSGLTVYSWDRYFLETAADLAMDLIARVPVFRFSCTPDPYAAACLERELRKELNL